MSDSSLSVQFSDFMDKRKDSLKAALPAHISADRMIRIVLTAFDSNPMLQECSPQSIYASVLQCAQLGLEPGIDGQAYLIPYKGVCTFVPGWKGIIDIVNRSGRSVVWTGAVFEGDDFEYELGTSPYIKHRPGNETDPTKITHTWAVGAITGSSEKIIEVWNYEKLTAHFIQANKSGNRHYRWKHPEMYFRKVPLLQVCKYLPKSVELSDVIAASYAAEQGEGEVIDADGVIQGEGIKQPRKAGKPADPPPPDVQDVKPKDGPKIGGVDPVSKAQVEWIKGKLGVRLPDAMEACNLTKLDGLIGDGFNALVKWGRANA